MLAHPGARFADIALCLDEAERAAGRGGVDEGLVAGIVADLVAEGFFREKAAFTCLIPFRADNGVTEAAEKTR